MIRSEDRKSTGTVKSAGATSTSKKKKASGTRKKAQSRAKSTPKVAKSGESIQPPSKARQSVSRSTASPRGTHPSELDVDQVRIRAHEIFVERGEGIGDEVSDWLQAEREMTEIVVTDGAR